MYSVEDKKSRYICVYLTTRAVHLEIVQELTAETFLLAFRKFSLPRVMISDNRSTNLLAAEELRSLMDSPEVRKDLSKRGGHYIFGAVTRYTVIISATQGFDIGEVVAMAQASLHMPAFTTSYHRLK